MYVSNCREIHEEKNVKKKILFQFRDPEITPWSRLLLRKLIEA
jgi:hypothetical protein